MQETRVGLIGLGFMGSAVGRRLIERGFPLTVFDIAEEAVARMGARGAARARSAREVAAATDVVLGVPLFTLAPIRQLTSAIASQGKRDLSAAVIATVLESLAGVSLAKQPKAPGDK